jgi:hypothetical protein
MRCYANGADTCGGSLRNSVWSVGAGSSTTPAPAPAPTPTAAPVPVVVPPASSTGGPGTGGNTRPTYVSVTGGGSTPSAASAYVLTGAAGDGRTDDTSAIQAALDSARARGQALLVRAPASYYRITRKLNVGTSVIGDGSYPMIKMSGANGDGSHSILYVRGYSGSGLVIAGLRLDGGFTGSPGAGAAPTKWRASGGEWDSGIEILDSHNVTIRNNYIQNMVGDGILVGTWADIGPGSTNVLIQDNLIENMYRVSIFPMSVQQLAILDNRLNNPFGYGRLIDFEPNSPGELIYDVEVARNVMDQYPSTDWDGRPCSRYAHDGVPSPGGHLFLHDNVAGSTYGFGRGFWNDSGGPWDSTLVVSNNR